ncbi:diadenylate cyclase [Caloramator quimbayensis]|uniref:Diadenylate cyclase n=1 Tax=Caloramator quimbayensis TaxID=1147123 RepID=A0A1T4WQ06_9CLOT|nr:diadenylate cyclase CdaA [Caloramator quimbayensis]SKA79406.1 diadenylate cyclase [Caloramator quimbayensis]
MGNLSSILSLIRNIEPRNIIDILIVAYIFYKILMLIKETRAEQLIKGLILVVVVMKLSQILGFVTLYWIIQNTLTVGLIAIIVIFQPELRKALEHLGRSRFFTKKFFESEEEMEKVVSELAIAATNLSSTKTGALIVIEQETGLSDFVQSGVKLDAIVSSSLLENIFFENSPLHDGAVIIRRDRIYAAACVMPLTEQLVSKELGTRHRAAIGITENSDAIAIVVSEETGTISLAINGKLTRNYNAERLMLVLKKLFKRNMENYNTMFKRVKTWLSKTKNK